MDKIKAEIYDLLVKRGPLVAELQKIEQLIAALEKKLHEEKPSE